MVFISVSMKLTLEMERVFLQDPALEDPAGEGNRDAELIFVVALSAQRAEGQALAGGQILQRAGGGQQRRRLIEDPVEAAEHPVDAGMRMATPKRGSGAFSTCPALTDPESKCE